MSSISFIKGQISRYIELQKLMDEIEAKNQKVAETLEKIYTERTSIKEALRSGFEKDASLATEVYIEIGEKTYKINFRNRDGAEITEIKIL